MDSNAIALPRGQADRPVLEREKTVIPTARAQVVWCWQHVCKACRSFLEISPSLVVRLSRSRLNAGCRHSGLGTRRAKVMPVNHPSLALPV
jgi:RNase P subunit RPR2